MKSPAGVCARAKRPSSESHRSIGSGARLPQVFHLPLPHGNIGLIPETRVMVCVYSTANYNNNYEEAVPASPRLAMTMLSPPRLVQKCGIFNVPPLGLPWVSVTTCKHSHILLHFHHFRCTSRASSRNSPLLGSWASHMCRMHQVSPQFRECAMHDARHDV